MVGGRQLDAHEEGAMMLRLALAILIGFSTACFAQQSNDLSLGQVVSDDPQPGQQYVKNVHGDWEIRCVKANEGEQDTCRIYQLMRQSDGNPIAEIAMFDLPPGQQAVVGANIITPLGTLLQRGLEMRVDDGEARRYPFSFCTRVGCHSRIGLTAVELSSFERGNVATLHIRSFQSPDQVTEITLSLAGFTAAYDEMLGF